MNSLIITPSTKKSEKERFLEEKAAFYKEKADFYEAAFHKEEANYYQKQSFSENSGSGLSVERNKKTKTSTIMRHMCVGGGIVFVLLMSMRYSNSYFMQKSDIVTVSEIWQKTCQEMLDTMNKVFGEKNPRNEREIVYITTNPNVNSNPNANQDIAKAGILEWLDRDGNRNSNSYREFIPMLIEDRKDERRFMLDYLDHSSNLKQSPISNTSTSLPTKTSKAEALFDKYANHYFFGNPLVGEIKRNFLQRSNEFLLKNGELVQEKALEIMENLAKKLKPNWDK